MDRFPHTLLGNPEKRSEFLSVEPNHYFFNRNRHAFEAILYFYQSNGRLTRPANVGFETFESECDYFELPTVAIKEMRTKEGLFVSKEKRRSDSRSILANAWKFTEKPESSCGAQIFALFSFSMILVSVVIACLESVAAVQKWIVANGTKNLLLYVDDALNGWFLFEFLLRFVVSPSKSDFIKAAMNIVDALAAIPYFVVKVANGDVSYYRILRVLRFLRVFRLFRIGKHSKRMKLVGEILITIVDDVKELLLCLLIVIIFGGSIVYYTEMDQKRTNFTSIPQALWWAVQTVVVLGYGDIVPGTLVGKLFASFFMVFGALTIALPVLSVVTKFSNIYKINTKTT